MPQEKTIIISVGGSMIVPNDIDTVFLSQFKSLILDYVSRGFRFVLIAGGGKTARKYQNAANEITPLTKDDMDWLGIHSTRLNAHLLRSVFVHEAHPRIITSPHDDIDWKESVLIGAGWRPGWSTDYVSVLLAKNFAITKLINLSNIDYVYTDDPRKNPEAKKIEQIEWKEFRKLIPSEWDPGLSSPFDPVAAKECEKIGMEVAILNGNNLENIRAYIDEQPFVGTVIYPNTN
jgi:uridylate kinase